MERGPRTLTDGRAFDGVIASPLPGRAPKPRQQGQTMLIDKGLGLTETGDLLELAAEHIDYIKLTFGTAALYPMALLRAKVALIRSYGIDVYPGGTFFEVAHTQNKVDPYLHRCKELGFNFIEVSDGSIILAPEARRAVTRSAVCS